MTQWRIDRRAFRLTYMVHLRQMLGIPTPLAEAFSSTLREPLIHASEAFMKAQSEHVP